MIRLLITLMVSFSVVISNGQSPANYLDFNANDLQISVPENYVEVPVDSCVNVKGQLTTEGNQAVALDYVRVQIIDLDTEEVIRLTTEANGSFEHCLPCGRTFIILAYPRDYYCEEVRLMIRAMDCQVGNILKINLPLELLEIQESEGEGSNMSAVQEDSISKLRATNKAFLESISIAEEVPDEEEEIPTEYVAPPSPRLEPKPVDEEEQEEFDPLIVQLEEPKDIVLAAKEIEKTTTTTTVDSDRSFNAEVVPPMILTPIYYPFDSHTLDDKEKSTLDEVSRYLLENSNYQLKIAAYTDPQGTKIYNKILAKKRAQGVVEYLLRNGVDQARIIAEAKGEIGETEDYATARRTELNLVTHTSDNSENGNLYGNKYTSSIYYDFDNYRLNEQSTIDVENVINRLLAEPELTVEVRSHTDSRGSAQYNQWLSQKRANEVVRQMKAAGVDSERLRAVGVGEQELVNECSDDISCNRSAHAKNRRTEFIFI